MQKQRKTFISYSRVNKDFALKLAKELRSSGFEIWFDQLDIPTGSRWDDEIEKALETCEIFMVILTPASSTSENVKDEIGYAIDSGKRILPVLLQNANVPLRLRRFQYVDFTSKSFDEGVESAKELLTNLVEESTVPKMPAVGQAQASEEKVQPIAPAKQPAVLPQTKQAVVEKPEIVRVAPEKKRTSNWLLIGAGAAILLIAAVVSINVLGIGGSNPPSAELPTIEPGTVSAQIQDPVLTEEPTAVPTEASAPTATTEATAAATPNVPASEITDGKGVGMLLVPADDFLMGSDAVDADVDEKPLHTVYLDDYYIDKYEVTNAFYSACVNAGVCNPPIQTDAFTRSSYYGNPQFDEYPVVYVNWNMAKAFCEWRDARLPTEAEWEKAARGTDARLYPWGREVDCQKANYQGSGSGCAGGTSKVGSYESGKSPYGAYDLAGNVWEWVADWYSVTYYSTSVQSNPSGPDAGQARVLRGGSWSRNQFEIQVINRNRFAADYNNFDIGFRCASSLP